MLHTPRHDRPLTARQRDKTALAYLTPAAAELGLYPGINSVRALARCAEFTIVEPDALAESDLQTRLLDAATALTPDVEATAHGLITCDLATVLSSPAEMPQWLDATTRQLSRMRLPLALAIAATPDLARLTAHSMGESLNTFSSFSTHTLTDPASLHMLPLDTLLQCFGHIFPTPAAATDAFHVLDLWGLQTIGDLAALGAPDLHERLGAPCARLHHIITGRSIRPLTLQQAPEHFSLHHSLEHSISNTEPLLFFLRRLLGTLTSRLAAKQRVPRLIDLTLQFEDGSDTVRAFRIPDPSNDPDALARIIHTHLETLAIPAPIHAIDLSASPALPSELQHSLLDRRTYDPNRFAETLGRLSALIGAHNIGTPQPLDTHRDDAFTLIPAEHLLQPREMPPQASDGELLPSTPPLHRYRPPRPVNVLSHRRYDGIAEPDAILTGTTTGTIIDKRGPYLTSTHWWDPKLRATRHEWDVQIGPNLLRLSQDASDQWHLTGSY